MKIKFASLCIVIIFIFCLYISAKAADKDVITQDGGISAGWILTGAFIVIGALMTFIINDMKKQFTLAMSSVVDKLDRHDEKIKEHGENIVQLKTVLKIT